MANWIIWVAIVAFIVLMWMFMKARHFKHRIYALILLLIFGFLFFSFYSIVKENNINIKTFDGIVSASKLYLSWLSNAFDNTKTIAGNVIKMNWGANFTA